jgi:hypothetical protein
MGMGIRDSGSQIQGSNKMHWIPDPDPQHCWEGVGGGGGTEGCYTPFSIFSTACSLRGNNLPPSIRICSLINSYNNTIVIILLCVRARAQHTDGRFHPLTSKRTQALALSSLLQSETRNR